MIMKLTKCLQIVIIGLLLTIALCPTALAAGDIDTGQNVALDITYLVPADGDTPATPLSGASFRLYQVATLNTQGALTATAAFADYQTLLDAYTGPGHADDWYALAATLDGLTQSAKTDAAATGQTDADGKLHLPADNIALKPGLYLLTGSRLLQDGYYYDPAPALLMLPNTDNDGNWAYIVAAHPKFDRSKKPSNGGGSTSRRVLKIWQDEGHESARPQEVTVQLLRDGEVWDTQTLSAANNWRYTWSGLSKSYKWTLIEKAVEGYIGTVTQDGNGFVVTNTYSTPDTPGDTPKQPDNPNDNPGDTPDDNPGDTPDDTPDDKPNDNPVITPHDNENGGDNGGNSPQDGQNITPNGSNQPTLPQTGQMWWPIICLLCAGLALIVLGLAKRRRDGYER